MIMMIMMMNIIAQSTITKFNNTAQSTNSLTIQHKAQLDTLALQQKKSTIRNCNITAQSSIRNFNTARAQTGSLTPQHKAQLEP